MNHDNLDKLIALLKEVNEQEKFDITRYHHTCGAPSCIIGWCYTLETGKDKVEVDVEAIANTYSGGSVMKDATARFLDLSPGAVHEIACGWESVFDGETDGYVWVHGVPFEYVIGYLESLHEDFQTWQEYYDGLE
jgi:hypothetical protein